MARYHSPFVPNPCRRFQGFKGKYKVAAAVLSKKGKVLSYGTNSYTKTHPTQDKYAKQAGCCQKQYLHAEIAALVAYARHDTKRQENPHKIKVLRVNQRGETRMSKPCQICDLAIKAAGVKVVEYSI